MRIWVFLILPSSLLLAKCPLNTEISSPMQASLTIAQINQKKQEVIDELEDYKKELKKKKNEMITLLRLVKKIEVLSTKNQVSRKAMLKLWKDVTDVDILSISY